MLRSTVINNTKNQRKMGGERLGWGIIVCDYGCWPDGLNSCLPPTQAKICKTFCAFQNWRTGSGKAWNRKPWGAQGAGGKARRPPRLPDFLIVFFCLLLVRWYTPVICDFISNCVSLIDLLGAHSIILMGAFYNCAAL